MNTEKFANWALKRVPQGEFRKNYYKLLKEYKKKHGKRKTKRNKG